MAYINWEPRFSVGNATIDEQHQELFSLINRSYETIGGDPISEYEALWTILSKLIDYTRFHFSEEEGMMERAGFPQLAEHREQHRALIQKTEEMLNALENGEAGIGAEKLCQFIKEWIEQHVLTVDRSYMSYLATK